MKALVLPDLCFTSEGITSLCDKQLVPNSIRVGNLLWEFVPLAKAGSRMHHFSCLRGHRLEKTETTTMLLFKIETSRKHGKRQNNYNSFI